MNVNDVTDTQIVLCFQGSPIARGALALAVVLALVRDSQIETATTYGRVAFRLEAELVYQRWP